MDCSTPGFPVLHYLPEFAQTCVHWVGDAIQPSHPLWHFSSCPQSFPASGSFPVSQFCASGGQTIGISASALFLIINIQGWFPLGLTGLIFLLSKGLSEPSQFSSVTQSCPILCDPMDCSMPGSPVHHQLPELAQTHAHWVNDAIQPSHSLSSPSPLTFNLSQHQGLFKWVSSSHQVTKALEFQL